MIRVSVIGHFAEGYEYLDGQTIKTRILTKALECLVGEDQVFRIDTHGGFKALLKSIFSVWNALKKSKNVVIFPAHNGLRVYGILLPLFRCFFFKNRKIHYVVIGGWLPKFLEKKHLLAKWLKRFDRIYVETNTMKAALGKQGFENVSVVPNCKDLIPLRLEELSYQIEKPFKLCTFSRVMKEKGIDDAILAVKTANEKLGCVAYTLDIYGQVDSAQTAWFNELKSSMPEYVRYCGEVQFDKSVEVLKDYFALLFPTRFYTEGIPGTVIDAYAAGVPVISAKWESYCDIIKENITGLGYNFGDPNDLIDKLIWAYDNSKTFLSMKSNCLNYSGKFQSKEVVQELITNFI